MVLILYPLTNVMKDCRAHLTKCFHLIPLIVLILLPLKRIIIVDQTVLPKMKSFTFCNQIISTMQSHQHLCNYRLSDSLMDIIKYVL